MPRQPACSCFSLLSVSSISIANWKLCTGSDPFANVACSQPGQGAPSFVGVANWGGLMRRFDESYDVALELVVVWIWQV